MTTVWSAGPRLLTSPTMVPGWGRPWHAIDCRAVAATLDRWLRHQQSRHWPAVGVGGLALWRGHPVRWCRALCMHRAATTPASECTFHRNYVCPSVPTQNGRDGLAGWGGSRTYPVPSRGPNQGHQWKMHILGNCICCPACVAMWCKDNNNNNNNNTNIARRTLYVCMPFSTSDMITRNLWPLILRH